MSTQKKKTSRRAQPRLHRSANLNGGATRYAAPSLAVLGAVATTAATILMKARLAKFAQTAVDEARAAASSLSFGGLLAHAGLQRKPSLGSTLLPAIGALVVGAVSGAALTAWLTPMATSRSGDGAHSLRSRAPATASAKTEALFDAPV
jgi:hypothetical protein